jgi:HD-GYP domain-containing protein (c-di-GMP phosphodiesterase class II)
LLHQDGQARFTVRTREELSGDVAEAYLPFRIELFLLGRPLPIALYIPVGPEGSDGIAFKKLLEQGHVFTREWKQLFADNGIDWVYVQVDCADRLGDYFRTVREAILEPKCFSIEENISALYSSAMYLLQRISDERDNLSAIENLVEWAHALALFCVQARESPSCFIPVFSRGYSVATHSTQMCMLGVGFGAYLGWSKSEIADFAAAALLHDLGTMWIPDRILQKSTTLSSEELRSIRRHPHAAYGHLKPLEILKDYQLALVLQHHECIDGKGYPEGLKGSDIHPFARVTRIIDCYDALTTWRPYRGPLPPIEALKLMYTKMSGSLDVRLLEKYIRYLGT